MRRKRRRAADPSRRPELSERPDGVFNLFIRLSYDALINRSESPSPGPRTTYEDIILEPYKKQDLVEGNRSKNVADASRQGQQNSDRKPAAEKQKIGELPKQGTYRDLRSSER